MAPGLISENNNTEASRPIWLTEAFYTDILKKEFGKYEVARFQVEDALSKGENFSSTLHKIAIQVQLPNGRTETVNYLVKSMLISESTSERIGNVVFAKEMEMYEKIIPQMETLYKQFGINISVGPRCIKTQIKPPVIVMEDLKAKSYTNINRLEGMDLTHAEAVLEKLAKWHAATARIHELRGEYSDHFVHVPMDPETEGFFKTLSSFMRPVVKKFVSEWGDEAKYLDKVARFFDNFLAIISEREKFHPLEFNVLNHADAWCNNMMFKHDENGGLMDMKFVDFQICKWGSPAFDLQYFIFSSCNNDIKIDKFDYLVKFYHDHLVRNLKMLKYYGPIPSLIDLHMELLKKGFFGVHAALIVLTAVLLEPSDDASADNFFRIDEAGNNYRYKMYTNSRYVKAIQQILPFLDNRGLLDLSFLN